MQRALLAFAALLVAACGNNSAGTDTPDMAREPRPPLGEPLTASAGQWTWFDFPDSMCDDGTPTGMGVNPGTSPNVFIYLEGGGACWDWTTCVAVSFSVHGPYGKANFTADSRGGFGGIFDRNDADNPVRDYTQIYVPYCTSDVHAGNHDATYTNGVETRTFRHHGRANLEAFLKRIAGTWPAAPKVVISGSSAGGFGAAFGFPLARRYYPDSSVYLVDDSGPPLIGDEIPASFRKAWYDNWDLGSSLDPICPGCRDDLSLVIPAYAARWPSDRLSLLSSLQDKTIAGYFLRSATGFEGDLLDVAAERAVGDAKFRYFIVEGDTHTMLGHPHDFTSKSTPLLGWLTQQLSDDPAWSSTKP